MTQKNFKKMVVPLAAVLVLLAQNFGLELENEAVQGTLNVIAALLAAFGVFQNPEKQ